MAPNNVRTMDGNEAVASVAYRLNEVIAIYPITPASVMGELCDVWSSKARRNLWRNVPTVGAHTVHIASSSGCGVTEDVTYTLNVQGSVGTPISCSGNQPLTLSHIQTIGVALTVSGNCSVQLNNGVLWGGTAGIVIHDQGHVIVNGGVIGGGAAVSADGHGHGELRNAAVISPVVATQFSVVSDAGGNVAFLSGSIAERGARIVYGGDAGRLGNSLETANCGAMRHARRELK